MRQQKRRFLKRIALKQVGNRSFCCFIFFLSLTFYRKLACFWGKYSGTWVIRTPKGHAMVSVLSRCPNLAGCRKIRYGHARDLLKTKEGKERKSRNNDCRKKRRKWNLSDRPRRINFNSELKQRRFWATHVNRKWSFFIFGQWFCPSFRTTRLYNS